MTRKVVVPAVAVLGLLFGVFMMVATTKPAVQAKPVAEPAKAPFAAFPPCAVKGFRGHDCRGRRSVCLLRRIERGLSRDLEHRRPDGNPNEWSTTRGCPLTTLYGLV